MLVFRFRCGSLLSRCFSGRIPSILGKRTTYVSILVPFGLSIKNRFLAQCQATLNSGAGSSQLVGSKLLYYHDDLEKQRTRRNFISGLIFAVYRLFRILIRIVQLIVMYTPLLIVYPFVRKNESKLKRWQLWALSTVERSGPAFVKFAQWASTRRDLFSKEFCDLFTRLQTSTSPHPWPRTEKALKEALGPDWKEFFLIFDEKVVGSGCIAQVRIFSA